MGGKGVRRNKGKQYINLSGLLGVVGVAALLAPAALNRLAVNVRVVYGDDRVRRRLFRGKPGIEKKRNNGLLIRVCAKITLFLLSQ